MNNTDPSYHCHRINQIKSGFPGNPLGYSISTFLLQFSIISAVTRFLHFILRPIGQPLVVAQILVGVLLGPSLLGQSAILTEVFPRESGVVLDTLSVFGFMLFIFLIGVKLDLSIVVRSGRKALVIGILGFFVPLGLSSLLVFILNRFLLLDDDVAKALPHLVPILSMTAFPVMTYFLDELKLLNSEIGVLASSSSLVCDICLWSLISINFVMNLTQESSLEVIIGSFASAIVFITFVILVIRPAALWVAQYTPETGPVKEIYIFGALVVLMVGGLTGEFIGIHATTASLVLGLIIPDGPPFGAALVEKLDAFVSLILLPLYFAASGLKVDVFSIKNLKNFGVLQLVVLGAFVGKIIGSMLPLVVFRMPFRDALSLGLIMNSKGIFELAFLNSFKNHKVVTEEVYAIMLFSVAAITGIIFPIVKYVYDPSRRFVAYKRRTILHRRSNDELRILACVHSQENVHSIISLLQISNATKSSPINLVVLHLVRLIGRASCLLVPHGHYDKPHGYPTQSEHIFNAFEKLEQQNPGVFVVHCYKGISPHTTMHNDVCSLALEKRTILIILPFHRQWMSEEIVESIHSYRLLNKNVFEMAPCSVGILIDHQSVKSSLPVTGKYSSFRVVVLFFGGLDDREALAYAERMSDRANVSVTVLRFVTTGKGEIVSGTDRSKMLDNDIINEFKGKTQRSEGIAYKEKVVRSGMDVTAVVRSVINSCNLIMVGRRHGESDILVQLSNWNERGELGAVGEVLAASEFEGEAAVLVVQQQTKLWGLKDPEESTHLRRIKL